VLGLKILGNDLHGHHKPQSEIEALKAEVERLKAREAQLEVFETLWSDGFTRLEWQIDKDIVSLGHIVPELRTGKSEDETVMDDIQAFIDNVHPNDQELMVAVIEGLRSGESELLEEACRIFCPDGKYRWFFFKGRISEKDDKGKPVKLVGHLYNESRNKKFALKNKILAKLPNANPDLVMIMDLHTEILYANPAALAFIENGACALLPKNIKKLITQAYKTDTVVSEDIEIDEKHYIVKVKPFSDEKQCMVLVSDVTEQVRLRTDRDLYYEALNAIDQAILITDSEGKIAKVNRAFEELYQYSAKEVLGKEPRILNAGIETYYNFGYAKEEYKSLFSDLWESLLDKKKGTWEGVVINRTKDGNVRWVHLVTNAIKDEHGNITHFVAIPIDITDSKLMLNNEKRRLYEAISNLAELRDNETGTHMRRVGTYSKILAQEYGLAKRIYEEIEVFAPMHDIGKVGVPDYILLKPGRLTPEEAEIMKQHTVYGYNIAKNHKDLKTATAIIRSHHERYDGRGYPDGLAGEDIPIEARIVAIADVYDALRSKRPYKEPWSHEKAKNYILSNRGKQFDPILVDIFGRNEVRFEKIFDDIGEKTTIYI
jgi:PAS domain S-box-containing protein